MRLEIDIVAINVVVKSQRQQAPGERQASDPPTQGQKQKGEKIMATGDTPRKTTRSTGPTARTVDEKVKALTPRVGFLEDKVRGLDYTLADPAVKGGLVRTRKGMERAHDRLTKLGVRVADVESALAEVLKGGGRKTFIQELRARNVSDNDIGHVLIAMKPEDGSSFDFTDEQLVAEMFGALNALQTKVAGHEDRLNNVDRRLDAIDGPEGQLATLRAAVYADFRHTTVLQQTWTRRLLTERLHIRQRFSVPGMVVAAAVGVVVWLIIWLVGDNLTGKVHGTGNQVNKVVGTFQADLHYGWIGAFIGLALAGIIIILASHFAVTVDEEVEEVAGEDGAGNNAAPTQPSAPDNNAQVDQLREMMEHDGREAQPRTAVRS